MLQITVLQKELGFMFKKFSKSRSKVVGCCFAMVVPWANFIDVQAMGDPDLARLVFDKLLADSDGEESQVDSESDCDENHFGDSESNEEDGNNDDNSDGDGPVGGDDGGGDEGETADSDDESWNGHDNVDETTDITSDSGDEENEDIGAARG